MRQKSQHGRGKLVFIVGPTAVGKSETVFRLARKIGAEIISCDSMQAYRNIPIMSQIPPARWRRSVPHYLVEILDPSQEYSAARFREEALKLIPRILKKRKVPLITGGSGLYMKALLDGLFPSPTKDIRLREELINREASKGAGSLYSELRKVDPEAAEKIHPNDIRRIIRALEIYYLTGQPISRRKKDTEGITSEYDVKIFGLIRPREALYEAINKRVEKMFENGLIWEVKRISKKEPGITARAALGYKEVVGHLSGEYSLEDAKGLLKMNTRRLAKKQLTWFKADKRIKWINLEKVGIAKVVEIIHKDI